MKWERNTRLAIHRTFGDESSHSAEFSDIDFAPMEPFGEVEEASVKQTNLGHTIGKFEEDAPVGFAIALWTPDVRSLKDEATNPSHAQDRT